MRRRVGTTVAATAAVVLAACGGSGSDTVADPVSGDPAVETTAPSGDDAAGSDASDESPPDSAVTDPSATEAPATDTPDILRFTAPLVGGGEIDASTTAGTPTAFWFWAPT